MTTWRDDAIRLMQLAGRASDPTTEAIYSLDALTEIVAGAQLAQSKIVDELRQARVAWTQIGAAMGLTKQAVHYRYGRKVRTTWTEGEDVPLPVE